MTPKDELQGVWLRGYVADNSDKALYRVAEAARFHIRQNPSNAAIKAARVAVGLPAKPKIARKSAMTITPKRARAAKLETPKVKRLRLIRLRAIALYGHDPELRP